MLFLLLIIPRPSSAIKCAVGHVTNNHTMWALHISFCTSRHHRTCYSRRTHITYGNGLGDDNYVYGCGECLSHVARTDTQMGISTDSDSQALSEVGGRPSGNKSNCIECGKTACNTPDAAWRMKKVGFNVATEEPRKPFIPFKERDSFPKYEAFARPVIWAVPAAGTALLVSAVIYMALKARIHSLRTWGSCFDPS